MLQPTAIARAHTSRCWLQKGPAWPRLFLLCSSASAAQPAKCNSWGLLIWLLVTTAKLTCPVLHWTGSEALAHVIPLMVLCRQQHPANMWWWAAKESNFFNHPNTKDVICFYVNCSIIGCCSILELLLGIWDYSLGLSFHLVLERRSWEGGMQGEGGLHSTEYPKISCGILSMWIVSDSRFQYFFSEKTLSLFLQVLHFMVGLFALYKLNLNSSLNVFINK